MKLLTIKQVEEKVSMGKSTIYKLIKEGHFPKQHPIPFTTNARWVDEEIDDYIVSIKTSSPINYQDNQTTTASA